MAVFRVGMLLALSSICWVHEVHAQSPRNCDSAEVHYGPAPEEIQRKIRLTPSPGNRPDGAKPAQPIRSPQGTRSFVQVDPDYTSTRMPWNTTLYIHTSGQKDSVLRAEFLDHGNTFTASWINEKLLFVQVWWGRMASSDLILDVEKGKLVYHELANYDETSEPCQSVPDGPR